MYDPYRMKNPSRQALAPFKDQRLIQIVDAALAETTRQSGAWLACKPGCAHCCTGVFAINQLDSWRLRRGLAELIEADPPRAQRVLARGQASLHRLSADFPGDVTSGCLDDDESARQRFSEFGNDEPCPVLDPDAGTCDLYEFRPMTCRVFGPPIRQEEGLAVCELCYQGATHEEIAACEMRPDPDDMETKVLQELENKLGVRGETIVAYSVASVVESSSVFVPGPTTAIETH
jgi:Fe-S-cluster containining protein